MIDKSVKSLLEFFGLPSLLFGLSFISIYYFPAFTPAINGVVLLYSYRQIVKFNRFDYVIIQILFSRCINGFVILHNYTVYNVFNVLTNIVPVLAYIWGLYNARLLSFDILSQS